MKIQELFEEVDQVEAEAVYKSLVATNDPAAKYFQQTRYNRAHTTVDSAQRAAERLARKDLEKKSEKERKKIEKQRKKMQAIRDKEYQDAMQAAEPQQKKTVPKDSKFKGAVDAGGKQFKGALGTMQKAWQRGEKIGDKFTKATKK